MDGGVGWGNTYFVCSQQIFLSGHNKHICTFPDRDEGSGGNKTEETRRDSEQAQEKLHVQIIFFRYRSIDGGNCHESIYFSPSDSVANLSGSPVKEAVFTMDPMLEHALDFDTDDDEEHGD